MKKKILTGLTAFSLCAMIAIPAMAETVYFKGKAVSWDHGRRYGVTSYSEVQTKYFTHSATANTTWSGWEHAGIPAKASQFVGLGQATAYWDCK